MNEEAREVVADLDRSLAEQSISKVALLEQPAQPASPVVPPPVMSFGPEPVTDQVTAEERAEEHACKQAEERHGQKKDPETVIPKKVAPRKKKAIPPELEERQRKASDRMLKLDFPPLQARIPLLLLKTCHLYTITFTY